jgi:ferredoxin
MKNFTITKNQINNLASKLLNENWNVISPSIDGSKYSKINSAEELIVDSSLKPTAISMKEHFFPKSETLFFFKRKKDDYELIDIAAQDTKTVIFGAKPCDASAIPVLSKVFNWDYKDEFFNKRVENTIVIGLACKFTDENCFCTSVGLSPLSENGSDIFLIPLNENKYLIKEVTEKGEDFISANRNFVTEEENLSIKENDFTAPEKRFSSEKIKAWLDNNFESSFWMSAGETCLGCAQCAYVCPTCHCFDIVDEDCYSCGRRVKNWDSCQFELFTKHASGHNPREIQGKRYRQRVSHKFKYYKDRFDEILCTGCGRCTRGCPVSIDIGLILEDINSHSLETLSVNN